MITIKNLSGRSVAVANGHTILQSLQENCIDWMHACGGKGRCITCRFVVIKGAEHIGQITSAEKIYKDRGQLLDNERLACQAVVSGDIEIWVPEDTQLPHISYCDNPAPW